MRAHELLLRSGRQLRDVRVLVVGAAYKPGVADCANAPAVEIITRLMAEGAQSTSTTRSCRCCASTARSCTASTRTRAATHPDSAPKTTSWRSSSACSRATTTGGSGAARRCSTAPTEQRTGRRHFLLLRPGQSHRPRWRRPDALAEWGRLATVTGSPVRPGGIRIADNPGMDLRMSRNVAPTNQESSTPTIRSSRPDDPEYNPGQSGTGAGTNRTRLKPHRPGHSRDLRPSEAVVSGGRPSRGRQTRTAQRYLMNSISEYFGSGQRSSATSFSSRSATVADVLHRRDAPCRACRRASF